MGFEEFGAWQRGAGEVAFRVFFPGPGLGPYQYRTDDGSERIVVVLSFADHDQPVDVPLSAPGSWEDLLTGQRYVVDASCKLRGHVVPSNWGRVLRLM